jgi:signal peptidase II
MLFPIFNLADSGIVCGGILAVLLAILGYEMDGTRGGGKDAPEPGPAAPPPPAPGPAAPRSVTPPPPVPGPVGPRTVTPPPPAAEPVAPGVVSPPPRARWAADGYVPSAGPTAGPDPRWRPAPEGPARG